MIPLTFGHDGIVRVPVKLRSTGLPYRSGLRRSPNLSLYKIDHSVSCDRIVKSIPIRLEALHHPV
jgi:hypothetical protein